MFELGAGIFEQGREAGRRSGALHYVKEVMRKLNYSAEEALGLLGISGEQKEDVLEALAKEKSAAKDGVAAYKEAHEPKGPLDKNSKNQER